MKKLCSILIIFLLFGFTLKEESVTNEKPELIYIFDPLCGWCYGFSPVVQELNEKYAGEMNFSIYAGGMVLGEKVKRFADMAEFIIPSCEGITEYTGVEFGEIFYKEIVGENGTYIGNSEPPTRALCIFKELKPEKAIWAGHNIQKLLYMEGKDLNNPEVYFPMAEQLGITKEDFLHKFNSDHFKHKAQHDFHWTAKHGLVSFPSLVYREGSEVKILTEGYDTFKNLSSKLEKLKKKK